LGTLGGANQPEKSPVSKPPFTINSAHARSAELPQINATTAMSPAEWRENNFMAMARRVDERERLSLCHSDEGGARAKTVACKGLLGSVLAPMALALPKGGGP
jgi:hypothetical protein